MNEPIAYANDETIRDFSAREQSGDAVLIPSTDQVGELVAGHHVFNEAVDDLAPMLRVFGGIGGPLVLKVDRSRHTD